MNGAREDSRRQGTFAFEGALKGETMPPSARRESDADEVRGPPSMSDEPTLLRVETKQGSEERAEHVEQLNAGRQVSVNAETLADWREHAEETLSLLKSERERLEAAAQEFQDGGWKAVTSISAKEKVDLIQQVEREVQAGGLPIPRFIPSYLGPNIKRLEERVVELATLRPSEPSGGSTPR